MVQKKVVVYETKSVNELAIENVSDDDIYVQAGDIVKGGQQDRMIGVDLIVPSRSGKLPISAFCVEHGRWSGRANERSTVFSSSADMASTKEIKAVFGRTCEWHRTNLVRTWVHVSIRRCRNRAYSWQSSTRR
jgi:hypothetical protein